MTLVLKEDVLVDNNVFIIRKLKEDDTENMYHLLSNKKIMEFIEPPFSYTKTKEFLKKYALVDTPLIFCVSNKNKEFIGYVIFKPYDDISYEIGWIIKKEYWGNGLATHITNELIQYAKNSNIKKLVIEFDKNQKASETIAVKCGFNYAFCDNNLIIYEKKLEH